MKRPGSTFPGFLFLRQLVANNVLPVIHKILRLYFRRTMLRKLCLYCLILLSAHSVQAQFNDSTQHYLKFASTGVINKTNETSSYVLKNTLNFNAQKKRLSYNTFLGWVYGAQKQELTNNDLNINGTIDLNKNLHKLYYWGLLNFDKSYSLNINYRLQVGAGIAYTFIDSPSVKVNVSDGILYEKGDLIDATIGKDVYQIPRNSLRLTYRWTIHDRLQIEGVHFYQPSLVAINDYIIQSTNSASVKLNKWLNITASLLYNEVSRTHRNNLLFTYGFSIEKYF